VKGLEFLTAELDELRARDLFREPASIGGALVLCSNDYLGYAADSDEIRLVAARPPSSGAGASRLISGEHPEHAALERELAAWVGLESALVFTSGYAANVGTIAALAGVEDVIVSDALNHASIIDGCRLSRARVEVTPHLELAAIEAALIGARFARRRFVVTESYFSMDGDSPDLKRLRDLCDAHDAALLVDEAHALGVLGPRGRGVCADAGVVPDVLVGTLGKAIGMQGAFVAGSPALRAWLWNRARSFVFSTGMAPWLAAVTRHRLARVIADDAARARLEQIVARVRTVLATARAPIAPSRGPILPWITGDAPSAIALRDRLLSQGLFVQAIRPPTVPAGKSRLRITLHARLSDSDVDGICQLLTDAGR
jgi:8-amino-7-oxononanoate synthase